MKIFMKILKIVFNVIVILGLITFFIGCLYGGVKARKENEIKLTKEAYERGYVDACKDFYQGKLKYDLVSNPDGTREWKKIK